RLLVATRVPDLPRWRRKFFPPSFSQVLPLWIHRLDQSNLLFASPALDFLFPTNRRPHVREDFVIDQLVDIILAGEPGGLLALMLQSAVVDAVGDAGVKRAGKARQNVHVVEPLLSRHREFAFYPCEPSRQTHSRDSSGQKRALRMTRV